MSNVLNTTALAVGHGKHVLLRDLDLSIAPGQLVCIIGRNGSGKSSLLRTLCALLPPLSGSVCLGDRPMHELSALERARRAAIVFAGRTTQGQVTVFDAVAMGRHPWTGWTGKLSAEDFSAVSRAMALLGADGWNDRMLQTLSDGEYQKVMIARAIAQGTPLLLMDEPTAFLDLTSRVQLMRTLKKIAEELGKGILLSSHDLQLALELSDALLVIGKDGGHWTGTPREAIAQGVISREFDDGDVAFDAARGAFRPRQK
ncbi:MAG: ABC transporter ATP-binding protein [Flavobacteriales bacterium]